MNLPFQKVKKSIAWPWYIDWDNRYFFSFIQTAHTFLLNQFILCKEEVVATYLMWNVANLMADEV